MRARDILLFGVSLCAGACGGGGTRVASTPTPATQPPSPPPPAAIKIFATPTVGEYASIGASIVGEGGNLDTYNSPNDRFGPISTTESDQAHIRYTSGGFYEVKLAGADWDRLVAYKGLVNPGPENNYFQPASVPMNYGYVVTGNSRDDGYLYSELASWGSKDEGRLGYVAFGVPTADGGIPTTGSATFNGIVSGSTDIMLADNLLG